MYAQLQVKDVVLYSKMPLSLQEEIERFLLSYTNRRKKLLTIIHSVHLYLEKKRYELIEILRLHDLALVFPLLSFTIYA